MYAKSFRFSMKSDLKRHKHISCGECVNNHGVCSNSFSTEAILRHIYFSWFIVV